MGSWDHDAGPCPSQALCLAMLQHVVEGFLFVAVVVSYQAMVKKDGEFYVWPGRAIYRLTLGRNDAHWVRCDRFQKSFFGLFSTWISDSSSCGNNRSADPPLAIPAQGNFQLIRPCPKIFRNHALRSLHCRADLNGVGLLAGSRRSATKDRESRDAAGEEQCQEQHAATADRRLCTCN